MKSSIQTLTVAMLTTLTKHASNPRDMRFDIQLARSFAENGYSPVIDAVTGVTLHPVVSQDAKGKLTILRGCGRLGTLKTALGAEKPKTLSSEHQVLIARMLEKGEVQVLVLTDASKDECYAIANDDDALKRPWSVVHRYHQYKHWRVAGKSIKEACRMVGYGSIYQHFTRLEKLPVVVQQAWIDGKLDTMKVQFTDAMISDIYTANNAKDSTPANFIPEAKQLYQAFMERKIIAKATVMSDQKLVTLQRELVGTSFAGLIAAIRGRNPLDDKPITETARGEFMTEFVAANKVQLPSPDDANESVGDKPLTRKERKQARKLANA